LNTPSRPEDLLGPLGELSRAGSDASTTTVAIAFASNVLVAIAKTIAAVVTGSASILAEAAHSWADTGNEVFLLVANRRARRPPDRMHPLGHGREAYAWALLAAVGLFVAGAAVSVSRGFQELFNPEILVGVLLAAVALVLINRNRQFLVGEEVDPRVRAAVLASLLAEPEVARVTYLRLVAGACLPASVGGLG
jgi:divalent metal cation (Fe/Co/Zn/Cd) transporter